MPSPASLACFVMLALAANAAAPADAVPQGSAVEDTLVSVPDDSAVQNAIEALRQDPLMGGTHRVQRLHWRTKETEEPAKPRPWLRRVVEWIIAAAQWLARNVRALLIVATVLGAAMLAVLISRHWRRHGPRGDPRLQYGRRLPAPGRAEIAGGAARLCVAIRCLLAARDVRGQLA